MENLYEVLDCKPAATAEELRQAYLRLAKQHHPDKQTDGDISGKSKEMFVRVQRAWNVLSNPELRKHYDSRWRSQETYQELPVQEEVDLSQFEYDIDAKDYWYGCRCGGCYMLSLPDVEVQVKFVCCDYCSLMVRVIYAETEHCGPQALG